MLNTLSKTVAIASIMCTVLFAQNSTANISVKDSISRDSIQNQIKDSIQAQTNLTTATSVLNTKDTTQKKDSIQQGTAIPAAFVPAAIVPATALIPSPTPAPAPAEDPEKQAKKSKAPSFKFPTKDSTKVPEFKSENPKPDSSAQASSVADTVPSKPDSPNKKILSTIKQDPQIVVTERKATKEAPVIATKDTVSKTQPTEKASSDTKKTWRTNKTLQSYNLNFPFESETWEVNSNKYDWNSIGIVLSWTRYKAEESGYSTLFGLAAGYTNGNIEDSSFNEKIKFNGLSANMKMGVGFAPVSNELFAAIYFIGEVNAKIAYGKVKKEEKEVNPFAVNADLTLGGSIVVGYQALGSFGFLAGIDITTNAFGIGGYSQELTKASKIKQLKYVFTGVNVTPHVGFFFAF